MEGSRSQSLFSDGELLLLQSFINAYSSTKQSQRVCVDKQDALERQELYKSDDGEKGKSERLDAKDDLTDDFIPDYVGPEKQDHGAGIVTGETNVKSDSGKEGQHTKESEETSLTSDSEKEWHPGYKESEDSDKILVGDVNSDPSFPGKSLEEFDTSDYDIVRDWAFGVPFHEDFHGTGFDELLSLFLFNHTIFLIYSSWFCTLLHDFDIIFLFFFEMNDSDKEVDEHLARIARARDMEKEAPPESDADRLVLYGLPRDYLENIMKTQPPSFKFEFLDPFSPSVEEEEELPLPRDQWAFL